MHIEDVKASALPQLGFDFLQSGRHIVDSETYVLALNDPSGFGANHSGVRCLSEAFHDFQQSLTPLVQSSLQLFNCPVWMNCHE